VCQVCGAQPGVLGAKLKAVEEARTALRHGGLEPQRAEELTALLIAADEDRMTARDALVRHREGCHFHT
jgi:hypothetical protein